MTFNLVQRHTGNAWVHDTKPMWIVHYELSDDDYYQAYVAIEKVKKGAEVWSANNKRIGNEKHGFRTLEAAMQAVEDWL